MPSPIERRALLALYRNHPATAPGDRYNWRARAEASRNRDMLLGWAATQTDETLLHFRNLGTAGLAWIREQTGDPMPSTRAGQWLLDRSRWDDGMRGFFVRINATAGPEDMLRHIDAIEAEARAALLAGLEAGVREEIDVFEAFCRGAFYGQDAVVLVREIASLRAAVLDLIRKAKP